jgi:hypothetical protein
MSTHRALRDLVISSTLDKHVRAIADLIVGGAPARGRKAAAAPSPPASILTRRCCMKSLRRLSPLSPSPPPCFDSKSPVPPARGRKAAADRFQRRRGPGRWINISCMLFLLPPGKDGLHPCIGRPPSAAAILRGGGQGARAGRSRPDHLGRGRRLHTR